MSVPLARLFDLTGRVGLVTGGSRGLGLQAAEALGENGATIALIARKEAELNDAVDHLALIKPVAIRRLRFAGRKIRHRRDDGDGCAILDPALAMFVSAKCGRILFGDKIVAKNENAHPPTTKW